MAVKRKPTDDDEEPISSRQRDIPQPHIQPPLSSTLPDRVALRIHGITYLVAPGAVEGFKAKHVRPEHHDEGFDDR